MLFVFEDDAHCVSNVIERTWSVVQKLPEDWDILYIGGKPMCYYTGELTMGELSTGTFNDKIPRPSNQELKEKMCQGGFGTSNSGPYAPGTSFSDSFEAANAVGSDVDPPYWQVKYVLDTHSYVVNPKRIKRVLRVLSAPADQYFPVDVKLAYDSYSLHPSQYKNGAASDAPLKAYLTPHSYCDQAVRQTILDRNKPPEWEGFLWLPWNTFEDFPDKKGYVWGKTASRNLCRGIWNATATK